MELQKLAKSTSDSAALEDQSGIFEALVGTGRIADCRVDAIVHNAVDRVLTFSRHRTHFGSRDFDIEKDAVVVWELGGFGQLLETALCFSC